MESEFVKAFCEENKNCNNNDDKNSNSQEKPAIKKKPDFLIKQTADKVNKNLTDNSRPLKYATPTYWNKMNTSVQQVEFKETIGISRKAKLSDQKKGFQSRKTISYSSTKQSSTYKLPVNSSFDSFSNMSKEINSKKNSLPFENRFSERRSYSRPKTPGVKELKSLFEQKSESNAFENRGKPKSKSFSSSKYHLKPKSESFKSEKKLNFSRSTPKSPTRSTTSSLVTCQRETTDRLNDREKDLPDEIKEDQKISSTDQQITDQISKPVSDDINQATDSSSLDLSPNTKVLPSKEKCNVSPSGYLPMNNTLPLNLEAYEDMDPANEVSEIIYDVEVKPAHVLLPPTSKDGYHDIPDEELTSVESTEANTEILSSSPHIEVVSPPPLPANNVVGRRSKLFKKGYKLKDIVQTTSNADPTITSIPSPVGTVNSTSSQKAIEVDPLEDFNKQRNKSKRRSLFGFRKKRDKVKNLKEKERSAESDSEILSSNVADDIRVYSIQIGENTEKLKTNSPLSTASNSCNVSSSSLSSTKDFMPSEVNPLRRDYSSSQATSCKRLNSKDQNSAEKTKSFLHNSKRSSKSDSQTSSQTEIDNLEFGVYEELQPAPPLPIRRESLIFKSQPITAMDVYEDPVLLTSPVLSRRPPPPIPQVHSSNNDFEDHDPPPIPPKDISLNDEEPSYEEFVVPSIFRQRPSSSFLKSEPLYQVYRNRQISRKSNANSRQPRSSFKKAIKNKLDTDWKSEMMADEISTSTMWRTIPEVVNSGLLDNMSSEEIKLQQAQFEVLTSQASYLRSLNILVDHFMKDEAMSDPNILSIANRRCLFSNLERVHEVEQRFLRELENHFWNELKLTKVCDFITKFANEDFNVYQIYIQNQIFQERKLNDLQNNNPAFTQALIRLESSAVCNRLTMMSFLLLPFQRACRLPLLVEAIVNAADPIGNPDILKQAKFTLAKIRKLVKTCNESAKKIQQIEQVALLASLFKNAPNVKTFALVSESRYLVKKGEVQISYNNDNKKGSKSHKLWLFLFNDVLFIARKKSGLQRGTVYEVIDWVRRHLVFVNKSAYMENVIFVILLENQADKRVELTMHIPSQNEHSRWLQALTPSTEDDEGEKIYEEWDCPQITCRIPYQAIQPDEMTIEFGDVMKITKKTPDGWSYGERLSDGEFGWVPLDHCEEIQDEHVRARNMKNQYKADFL